MITCSVITCTKVFLSGKKAKKPKGVAPQVTQPLKATQIVEGNPVRLKCRMTGSPEPTAEWLKNGEQVELSQRIKADVIGDMCQLSFAETQEDDSGSYKCVIINDLGSTFSEAELVVTIPIVAPKFKEKLKGLQVNEGEQVQLDVRVSGNPTPNVSWFRGPQAIINEGRFIVKEDDGDELYSLIIDETTSDDSGTYKCVASNEAGKATCRGELEVNEKLTAPEFAGVFSDAPVIFREGEEVSMEVTIRGKPAPDVEWYKDELSVRKSSNMTTLVKGEKQTLLIYNAKPADSGVYKCVAKSNMGTAMRTFNITVEG